MDENKDLQVENGNYTRIVNPLIERLIQIPFKGCELALVIFIIRKTYGYNKKQDEISLTQFERGLERSRPSIVKALKNLQLVKIVKLVKVGNSKNSSNLWEINKYYKNWELVNTVELVKTKRATSKAEGLQLVKTPLHTKDNTKDNTKEKDFVFFQNEEFKELWENYLEMRKKIRKPATKKAEELILKKLHKHRIEIAVAMVEKSIENSWQGIFPLRPEESEAVMRKIEIVTKSKKTEMPVLTDEDIERNKKTLAKMRGELSTKFSFKN